MTQGADTTRTRFDYLGLSGQVAAEERSDATHSWQVTKTYAYGPDGRPLVLTSTPLAGASKTRLFSTNAHGDTELLTDPGTGDVTSSYRYTAYGNADSSGTLGEDSADTATGGSAAADDPTADVVNPYRYSSKRVDASSGGYDMGFRTYEPGLNSFLSRDMYSGALADVAMGLDPWNTNRYAFAGGNPISHVDLDGHLAKELDHGGVDCDAACAEQIMAIANPPEDDGGGGLWGSVSHFVSEHKADIAGIATSIAVGVACEVATAGAGSVGCIMAAGAAGSAVTNAMDPNADHSIGGFAKSMSIGAVTNLAGAGLGKLAGAGIRAAASKVGGKAASKVASAASCLLSFSGATRVLMADGSTKAIKDVKVGDRVMAKNPITGEHGARRVQHLWPHHDDLMRLDIDGGSVVTTEDHPYWNATDHAWEQIQDFDEGDKLLTANGRLVAVRGLDFATTHLAAAYNLTVAGIHTYYVVAGHHAVLVHNCGGEDVAFNQVQDRIATHVMPLHGAGTPATGTKFAEDLDEEALFNGLLERLHPSNATGRLDDSGNHEHILSWPGAGANGEDLVRVWMTPDGLLGGMWPI